VIVCLCVCVYVCVFRRMKEERRNDNHVIKMDVKGQQALHYAAGQAPHLSCMHATPCHAKP
jgi:hypothetical protein